MIAYFAKKMHAAAAWNVLSPKKCFIANIFLQNIPKVAASGNWQSTFSHTRLTRGNIIIHLSMTFSPCKFSVFSTFTNVASFLFFLFFFHSCHVGATRKLLTVVGHSVVNDKWYAVVEEMFRSWSKSSNTTVYNYCGEKKILHWKKSKVKVLS